MQKQIKLLTGPICSGKTTWCDAHRQTCDSRDIPNTYLKVSDVVKRISSAQSRSELQKTGRLVDQISKELINEIDRALEDYDVVLVDGIRQLHILLEVMAFFPVNRNTPVQVTWLDVSEEERRKRFESRKQPRDMDITFDQANENDENLGLKEVRQFLTLTNIIS